MRYSPEAVFVKFPPMTEPATVLSATSPATLPLAPDTRPPDEPITCGVPFISMSRRTGSADADTFAVPLIVTCAAFLLNPLLLFLDLFTNIPFLLASTEVEIAPSYRAAVKLNALPWMKFPLPVTELFPWPLRFDSATTLPARPFSSDTARTVTLPLVGLALEEMFAPSYAWSVELLILTLLSTFSVRLLYALAFPPTPLIFATE